MTTWLLDHDWAVQLLAASSLAVAWWISSRIGRARRFPDPKELPPMSHDWRAHPDRFKDR